MKLEIAKASDLRMALKQARTTTDSTVKVIRAHAKAISYPQKIESLRKSGAGKINAILKAFSSLDKAVVKRIGNTTLTKTMLITPQVVDDIITPYRAYLEAHGGAKSIDDALVHLESDRAKELSRHGHSETLRSQINEYYTLKREKYLMPLRTIEVQINGMLEHLDYKEVPKLDVVSKKVIQLNAPAQPNKTASKSRKRKSGKVAEKSPGKVKQLVE